MTPVFTSQLTIIVVFLPLVLADFESWLKPILGAIAFTVTAAITASTLAAFFFVPVFSDRFLKNDKKVSLEGEGKEHFIVRAFTNLLRKALRHRIKTIMLAVSLFVGSFFLMPFMKMGQGINPNENMVFASITMPTGSTLENTQRAALDAETTLRELPDVKDVFFFASKENAELFLMLKGKKRDSKGKTS